MSQGFIGEKTQIQDSKKSTVETEIDYDNPHLRILLRETCVSAFSVADRNELISLANQKVSEREFRNFILSHLKAPSSETSLDAELSKINEAYSFVVIIRQIFKYRAQKSIIEYLKMDVDSLKGKVLCLSISIDNLEGTITFVEKNDVDKKVSIYLDNGTLLEFTFDAREEIESVAIAQEKKYRLKDYLTRFSSEITRFSNKITEYDTVSIKPSDVHHIYDPHKISNFNYKPVLLEGTYTLFKTRSPENEEFNLIENESAGTQTALVAFPNPLSSAIQAAHSAFKQYGNLQKSSVNESNFLKETNFSLILVLENGSHQISRSDLSTYSQAQGSLPILIKSDYTRRKFSNYFIYGMDVEDGIWKRKELEFSIDHRNAQLFPNKIFFPEQAPEIVKQGSQNFDDEIFKKISSIIKFPSIKKIIQGYPKQSFMLVGEKNSYHITIQDNSDKTLDVTIQNTSEQKKYQGSENILLAYNLSAQEKKKIPNLNHKNITKTIKIKNKIKDQYKEKMDKLDIIHKNIKLAIDFLKENDDVFDALLDNYLQNGMVSFEKSTVFLSDEFKGYITKIHFLKTEIGEDVDHSQILTTIILDANCCKEVIEEQGFVLQKTMELLEEGMRHVEDIEGRDLILLFGNTGSGKSTFANYLIGIPLKKSPNQYGRVIIEVNEREVRQNAQGKIQSYPKIGQSMAVSETTYVHGYEIRGKGNEKTQPVISSISIVDCPGTGETRGDQYELSAMLSLQQMREKARSIKSIVITIPYEAFFLEKANSVMNLFLDINEKIHNAFSGKNKKINSSIFLVITKYPEDSNILELKDGMEDIVKGFLEDEKKRIPSSSESIMDYLELKEIYNRIAVWETLCEMFSNEQVDFMDIVDSMERQTLLEKYIMETGIKKEEFENPLDASTMQKELGNSVMDSIDTWKEHIVGTYLGFPKEITNLENKVSDKVNNVFGTQKGIQNLVKSISTPREIIQQTNTKIVELHDLKNANFPKDKIIEKLKIKREELKDTQHISKSAQLEYEKKSLSQAEFILLEKNEEIKILEDEINQIENGRDIMFVTLAKTSSQCLGFDILLVKFLSDPTDFDLKKASENKKNITLLYTVAEKENIYTVYDNSDESTTHKIELGEKECQLVSNQFLDMVVLSDNHVTKILKRESIYNNLYEYVISQIGYTPYLKDLSKHNNNSPILFREKTQSGAYNYYLFEKNINATWKITELDSNICNTFSSTFLTEGESCLLYNYESNKNLYEHIKSKDSDIQKLDLKFIKGQINELSSGERPELIGEPFEKRTLGDVLRVNIIKDLSVLDENFQNLKTVEANQILSVDTRIVGNFRDTIYHERLVEKVYYIVPEDEGERDEFIRVGKTAQYRSFLQQVGCELYLGRKSAPSGKKIIYSIKSHWQDDKLDANIPHFQIIHYESNVKYNSVEIKKLENEKFLAETKKTEKNSLLEDLKREKDGLDDKKCHIEKNIASLKIAINKLETKNVLLKMNEIREECNNSLLNHYIDIYKKKNKLIGLFYEIYERQEKIEKLSIDKYALTKKKIHYALIIKTQGSILSLLMNFASQIRNIGIEEKNAHNKLYDICQSYIKFYQKNDKQLRIKCDEDLNQFRSQKSESDFANDQTQVSASDVYLIPEKPDDFSTYKNSYIFTINPPELFYVKDTTDIRTLKLYDKEYLMSFGITKKISVSSFFNVSEIEIFSYFYHQITSNPKYTVDLRNILCLENSDYPYSIEEVYILFSSYLIKNSSSAIKISTLMLDPDWAHNKSVEIFVKDEISMFFQQNSLCFHMVSEDNEKNILSSEEIKTCFLNDKSVYLLVNSLSTGWQLKHYAHENEQTILEIEKVNTLMEGVSFKEVTNELATEIKSHVKNFHSSNEAEIIQDKFFIPVNLKNNEWAFLYLLYSEDNPSKPIIHYYNPATQEIDHSLMKLLIGNDPSNPYANVKIHTYHHSSGSNCTSAPLLIEAARAVAEGTEIEELTVDIKVAREEHRKLISEITQVHYSLPTLQSAKKYKLPLTKQSEQRSDTDIKIYQDPLFKALALGKEDVGVFTTDQKLIIQEIPSQSTNYINEVSTIGDGNCAFNAIALGICDLLNDAQNNQIAVRLFNILFESKLLTPEIKNVDDFIEKIKGWADDEKQLNLASSLRRVAIQYIRDKREDYIGLYFERLSHSFDEYYINNTTAHDDLFLAHSYIKDKFDSLKKIKSDLESLKNELSYWWRESEGGFDHYLAIMEVPAKDASDRARWSGDEINPIAKLLELNINYSSFGSNLIQLPGYGAGMICNGEISINTRALLISLDLAEEKIETQQIFLNNHFTNKIREYLSPIAVQYLTFLNGYLNEETSINFPEPIPEISDIEEFREILVKREIIFKKSDGSYTFINDGIHIRLEDIKNRLEGIMHEEDKGLLLDHYEKALNIPSFSIRHNGAHWSYVSNSKPQNKLDVLQKSSFDLSMAKDVARSLESSSEINHALSSKDVSIEYATNPHTIWNEKQIISKIEASDLELGIKQSESSLPTDELAMRTVIEDINQERLEKTTQVSLTHR